MDELHYQIDLLTAMNQKLATKEFMYHTICETSMSAFLFFDLKKNTIQMIGNWSAFFDFKVENRNDLNLIMVMYEEENEFEMQDIFFLEKKCVFSNLKRSIRKKAEIFLIS